MNRPLLCATAALLTACPPSPSTPEVSPPDADVKLHDPSVAREKPAPLEARAFKTPTTEKRTLSNGLDVVVATNSEVPLVNITVAFNVAGFADEVPGQARVTFDMMNEGAADMSAAELSRKLKALASDLSTSAGTDGASVSITTLKKNLAPTLDLMEAVVEQPTFPDEEWTIIQKRYVAAVQQARKDPNAIASRVQGRILYGDTYTGRIPMEAHYQGMTTDQMKAWYQRFVGPQNAIVLVGGDVTADEIVPLLEARLGDWKPEGVESPTASPTIDKPEAPTLYFVDKPGAAQSVIRVFNSVGEQTDGDWFAYDLGMDVLGGTFMSRVNMNLREDKGYTYGARCSTRIAYGDNYAACSAGVQTKFTGPSLSELRKELDQIRGDARIKPDEIDYFKSTAVNGYPRRFETPGALLGEQATMWRYDLPDDWPERYLPSIEAVSQEQAQKALEARWDPAAEIWLVVGDKSQVGDDLNAFGLPVVELDADGNRVGG